MIEHRLILASDVSERDGMGLELVASDGTRVAEVFQDDTTGGRTVTIFGDRSIALDDFQWFLDQARERL